MPQQAKITRPRSASAVARPRLFARLDRVHRAGGAVWVSGQPGSGKTTLLTSWIEARRSPRVWLKVDASDADLASFFHYLALAARGAMRRPVVLPALLPDHRDDVESFARIFFRNMYKSLRPGTVLVLDDCHAVLPDAALHRTLSAAIEELPGGITIIFASRGELPPALARPRAHGALTAIEGAELELTPTESWSLARRRGFTGARASVEALRRAVNGWAAGLVILLVRAQRGASDPCAGSATFDYFAGEVFDRAEPATRRVLLEAALLDAPPAALVEQVTGDPGAGRILSSLARRGLFTVRRQVDPPAYEFHSLFRDFLLARGREELPPGRAAEVRRAAAGVLARAGGELAEKAIMLLAEAGAHDEMARLVTREAPALLLQGRWQTVERWIGLLPAEVRDADPWLLYCKGTALMIPDPPAARRVLAQAQAAFEQTANAAGAWLAWSVSTDAVFFEWKDLAPFTGLLREHERLSARFPFPSPEIQARATVAAFAAALVHELDHRALPTWAEAVRALAMSSPIPAIRIAAGGYLLLFDSWVVGAFERDRDLARALGSLARDARAPPRSVVQWLNCEATYHFCAGDFDACTASAADALRAADATAIHIRDFLARLLEFCVAVVRSPRELPARLLAMERALRWDSRPDVATMRFAQAAAASRRGDPRAAVAFGEEALAVGSGYALIELLTRLVLARARARAGDVAGARRDLADAHGVGERTGSAWFRFMAALIEAELLLDGTDPAAVSTPLATAFALAREKGVHPYPVFAPEDLARLCAEALARGIEVEYVRALIRARGLRPPQDMPRRDAWPWPARIRTLGPFQMELEGTPVRDRPRSPRKPLELLRVLIAHGGRDVPESAIAESLWPQAEGDAAHRALDTTLHRLRRMMGRDAIMQRNLKLSIRADQCWVDALELEAQLDGALSALESARESGRRADLMARASRIADLYLGPLLADDEASWAGAARDRLRRKLERWLHVLEATLGSAEVAPVWRRINEADPELCRPST